MTRVSHAIDRIEVSFDDPNLVANAGLLLTATLADRLELETMIDATVKLGDRVSGARPGRKVLTLRHGYVRQLEAVNGQALERAWTAGIKPGADW